MARSIQRTRQTRQPVFLISTSAGEVGFNLNANHMVCDVAPLDSMIQHLGRVNRRGRGEAIVRLIIEHQENPAGKTGMDKACMAASRLIRQRHGHSNPKTLSEMKANLWRDGSPLLLQLGVLTVDEHGFNKHARNVLLTFSTPPPLPIRRWWS